MHQAIGDPRPPLQTTPLRKFGSATPATHCVGIVTVVDGDRYVVTSGDLVARARRAASCLLEPTVGDSVACLMVAPDQYWVLAILQREDGVENCLRCEGPTRMEINGPLGLHASELDLRGNLVGLRADRIDVTTDEAIVVGRSFRLVGSAVNLIGALLSTAFDRVSHFSKHHQRTTEGIDRVQAHCVQQDARELLQLSGKNTLITGETVVKARGGQIHLG